MDADGTFIGQVCHIEAAEENGERFNAAMTDEARRQAANLMLMCYEHHQKTNDVAVYTVAKLKQMKADHEKRFSHPDRAILEKLTDWTEADEPAHATNLIRLDAAVGWGHAPHELAETATELKEYVGRLRNVPIDLRRFMGAVAKRAAKMEKTNAFRVGFDGIRVLTSDLKGAFRLSERAIGERANQLDAYGLGDLDMIDTDLGPKAAVRIRIAWTERRSQDDGSLAATERWSAMGTSAQSRRSCRTPSSKRSRPLSVASTSTSGKPRESRRPPSAVPRRPKSRGSRFFRCRGRLSPSRACRLAAPRRCDLALRSSKRLAIA